MEDEDRRFLRTPLEWVCFLIGAVGIIVLIGLGIFGVK